MKKMPLKMSHRRRFVAKAAASRSSAATETWMEAAVCTIENAMTAGAQRRCSGRQSTHACDGRAVGGGLGFLVGKRALALDLGCRKLDLGWCKTGRQAQAGFQHFVWRGHRTRGLTTTTTIVIINYREVRAARNRSGKEGRPNRKYLVTLNLRRH